jgi:hypothetical protein
MRSGLTRFAGWQVERVGSIGDDWIPKLWLPKAREMLAAAKPHNFNGPAI